jgi:hypothetical protein
MTTHLSTTEIESRLGAAGASPRDDGKLDRIVCRPERGERQLLDSAELDLTAGLVGDNWKVRGSKDTPDGSANFDAQITLANSRVIDAMASDQEMWPLAGDQLYVDFDISIDNLPPGQQIAIGSVILEVSTKPHTGCAKFTERFGHDAIRMVNSKEGLHQRWRGVNTRIVQPGTIHIGDVIHKVELKMGETETV